MKIYLIKYVLLLVIFPLYINSEIITAAQDEIIDDNVIATSQLYKIEGKVFAPEVQFPLGNSPLAVNAKDVWTRWQTETQASINGGKYKGFIREDGTFVINGVPYGSYVLEINNPDYYFESVRVEISPKGKFRARKVNYVQPSQVVHVPYPLKIKALTRFKYFQQREQWKITDFLFSPMVLMMVLPLLLMLVLPKVINDPETKKELENIQFPKVGNEMPEISEVITSLFSSKPPEKEKERERKFTNTKNNKKRN